MIKDVLMFFLHLNVVVAVHGCCGFSADLLGLTEALRTVGFEAQWLCVEFGEKQSTIQKPWFHYWTIWFHPRIIAYNCIFENGWIYDELNETIPFVLRGLCHLLGRKQRVTGRDPDL